MPLARLTTFTHDGLTFDVRDTGPIDGEVVVLLHGFPQRASSWDKVANLLHGHGYRTVAPDQRGYSPGARPPRRRDYTLDLLVGDVVALIHTLDAPRKVHLVGHDWGACVAWPVAARNPDLVASLVSVSVPHPAAFLRSMLGKQLFKSWYIAAFQLPWIPEKILGDPARSKKALRGMGMSHEMAATFRKDIVDHGALSGALNWYRALPLSNPRLTGGRVRVPTTHVWSDGDAALGQRGAQLAEEYVEAPYELQVLAGVSHWIPDEVPETLAEIVCERIITAGDEDARPSGH
ncbi:MAG: alpha/beta fold hydrolase [Nocardioides sp.]|nr:alpha/beta fold hydrolase [Nocardioides sp.]